MKLYMWRVLAVWCFGFVCGLVGPVVTTGVRNLRAAFEAETCMSRVKVVLFRLASFSDAHGGELPVSLETLEREGLVKEEDLCCPTSGARYVYLLEGKQVTSAALRAYTPVVVEHGTPHGHDPYMHVGYAGGAVGIMHRSQLLRYLEESPEAMSQAIGEAQRWWQSRNRQRREP